MTSTLMSDRLPTTDRLDPTPSGSFPPAGIRTAHLELPPTGAVLWTRISPRCELARLSTRTYLEEASSPHPAALELRSPPWTPHIEQAFALLKGPELPLFEALRCAEQVVDLCASLPASEYSGALLQELEHISTRRNRLALLGLLYEEELPLLRDDALLYLPSLLQDPLSEIALAAAQVLAACCPGGHASLLEQLPRLQETRRDLLAPFISTFLTPWFR